MRVLRSRCRRRGVAAAEAAVVLPVLAIFMLGTWEVGRLIEVAQIMSNAVREGARLAAQGQIVTPTGAFTLVTASSGTPNVTSTVQNYLNNAGINTTGLVVNFTFVDSSGNPVASPTDPYQATQAQRFRVTATLPYSSFRWTTATLFSVNSLTVSCDWVSMIDAPFTVNTTLPTWSPIP